MSLEQLSYLAQIIASIGVVLSLVFVGYQLRQSTAVLERGEHNSTMEQWTNIRMAIAEDRELAELVTAGLNCTRPLDRADEMRLDYFVNEYAWACFHIWDRTRRGVFPPGTFELSCQELAGLLGTPGGNAWWKQKALGAGLIPPFVADVDAMLAAQGAAVPG
jgi:hypothetical protein